MKKLLFVFFLILGAESAFSQEDYKTLQQCNNDTIEYVLYNFQKNKSRYVGKSMKFFLKEIEVSWLMSRFGELSTSGWAGPIENRKKIEGMWFCYLSFQEMTQYEVKGLTYFVVDVYFKVPPYSHNEEEFYLIRRNHRVWDEECYKFFKDYEIKDIVVLKCPMK